MRFFIELSYKGTRFSGFQIQKNATSIQEEIEKALQILFRQKIELTGSSRTDSGVHSVQNYFHFDTDLDITLKNVYNLNAILPDDIVVKRIFKVPTDLHARFHATHRRYNYFIYQQKNPFIQETAWYYPFTIDIDKLNEAATVLKEYNDFTSFSKRNTQTHTKRCTIQISNWKFTEHGIMYEVQANRFLRGMVRGLVATMLKVGRGQLSIADFRKVIEAKDCTKADFSAPAHGLCLVEVGFDWDDILNGQLG
jgi:tRNA pseudouridine38-40 synthase